MLMYTMDGSFRHLPGRAYKETGMSVLSRIGPLQDGQLRGGKEI